MDYLFSSNECECSWARSNIQHNRHIIFLILTVFIPPIKFSSQLHLSHAPGHHKCREQWPDNTEDYERAFNLFLDMILLIFPLVLLSTAYFSITRTLWRGMNMERSTRRHIVNYNAKHSGKFFILERVVWIVVLSCAVISPHFSFYPWSFNNFFAFCHFSLR